VTLQRAIEIARCVKGQLDYDQIELRVIVRRASFWRNRWEVLVKE